VRHEADELLEAYALGALEPEERADVERHLAGCPACRARARELEAVAHRLPQALAAVSALEPPAGLEARVLGGLPRESERPSGRRRLRVRPAAQAALAVLALLLVGGSVISMQLALGRERDLRSRLSRIIGEQPIVFEVVDSPRTVKRILRPASPRFADSYGKLYTRPDFREAVSFGARLPALPEGRAYHLWLTSAGRTRLAGVLTIRAGFGLLVVRGDRPGPTFERAELTLQAPGAARPGGTPVLVWRAAEGSTRGAAP
jgi:hypothetical protein